MHTVSNDGMCRWNMMKSQSMEKVFLKTPRMYQITYLLIFD